MITEQKIVYLSKKGMKELKKQIANLEHSLHHAEHDLRELERIDSREERFERIEALSRVELLKAELADKRSQQENAKQLPRKRDALKVALGSVVDLVDTKGRIVRYTLVDSLEANPSDGRISVKSPLGQSLVGRSAAETVEWNVGLRANKLQLVRIS
ncbi:MAG: Transcription elongation factor GreA [Candidatus Saccharibacteria bacterium GW2011_GWC2_48_9]|nr:MAG: Transcription elongation factor GreA [Candidatus Saccharibacteria bacterium GW2011_GWC2_48_9]